MGIITSAILLFSFTFSGLVWLVRDVDRQISQTAPAHSLAFQAARAGAQQIVIASLREAGPPQLRIDVTAAQAAVHEAVRESLRSDALASSMVRVEVIDVQVVGDLVTVEVEIIDGGHSVRAVGSARAVVGP